MVIKNYQSVYIGVPYKNNEIDITLQIEKLTNNNFVALNHMMKLKNAKKISQRFFSHSNSRKNVKI